MTSPFIPSSFTYGDSPAGGLVMPMVIAGRDPSNSSDTQYDTGYLWLSSVTLGGSGLLFYQGGNVSGLATWTVSSSAAGALNTLSNGVTTVFPSGGGNIAIEGTASQIISTASANTLTLSLSSALIAPGSVTVTGLLTANAALTVTAGGANITGNSVITGDLNVTGALTAGSISFVGLTVDGTVAINTTGTGTTTIGNATAGAIIIDVGTGNFALNGGGNTIDIGTDAAANTLILGNQNTTSSTHIQAGTGDVLIDGAVTAEIILGSVTQTGLITIGRSTAGENVSINDVVPAASRTTTISGGTIVGAGVTDTLDLAPDGATTSATAIKTVNINTGTVVLGEIHTNIASGTVTSGTHTTNIASGNRAAGTMAVNLLTGTGTKTLNIGNADGLTTSNILGPHNINVSQNNNTAINSGTSTGTVTIGNTLAGAVAIGSSAASNFTVTGAAADLSLISTGGSVNVTGTEAVNDAIVLFANNAAGGVQIKAGTGGVLIGNQATASPLDFGNIAPTATRNINIGTGTVVTAAVTDTINVATGGATTNANSIKTLNLNTGGVTTGQVLTNIATGTVTSGTHTTAIATGNRAAGTMAVNLLTGTGVKTLTIGNADALTVVNLNSNLTFNTAGNKILSTSVGTTTAAGANSFGTVALVGGTATVSTTSVTANSMIFLTCQALGTVIIASGLAVTAKTAATSFVITASQATDTSTIAWMIVN